MRKRGGFSMLFRKRQCKCFLITQLLMGLIVSWAFSQQQSSYEKLTSSDSSYQKNTQNKLSYCTTLDTGSCNKYGDLLNDDPVYNKKGPFWRPILGIEAQNLTIWSIDRFVSHASFSKISLNSWKSNLGSKNWVYDDDALNMNFLLHPLGGAFYFNWARSDGYSYFESGLFTLGGSLSWEYFGENTAPSLNDMLNTTINGMFIGEMLYRFSSNILDDRTTGTGRFFRELAAGIVDIPRGISRLLDGKMNTVTSKQVYQQEPLSITIAPGVRRINTGNNFNFASNKLVLDLQFDYGNPFEYRDRKPFDYFMLSTEFSSYPGAPNRQLTRVNGYGLLIGKNTEYKDMGLLFGLFQHWDYYNNDIFELVTAGVGPGVLSKFHISDNSTLYTTLHIAYIPFAGNSTRFGVLNIPDTRDYNYGNGLEYKLENSLELGNRLTVKLLGYYYWIDTIYGTHGNNFVGILKPMITYRLFNNISIGFEHQVYYDHRLPNGLPGITFQRTEERVFLSFYLEDLRYSKNR